jgi:hypothetical protein
MKHTIEVREVAAGHSLYDSSAPYVVREHIKRKLRAEQIGNFNPLFCRYRGNNRVLVHSAEGDLSDPFRREPSYARSLFIRVTAQQPANESAQGGGQ